MTQGLKWIGQHTFDKPAADGMLELITREAQQPTLAETAERTQRYARALREEHTSQ
ncbi:hypothetical protein GCM10022206_71940 [Streptomyces chiangmaiensis]